MAFCLKVAAISGFVGLVAMFALWMPGLPPHHFWLLAFWPSQIVGMGMDGVQILPEMAIQFVIYGIAGFLLGLIIKVVRRNA